MTNGQRLILGLCTLVLGAYVLVLSAMTTDAGLIGTTQGSTGHSAALAPPNVTDAIRELNEIGLVIEPYRHGVIEPEGNRIRIERNGELGFGVFIRPDGITHNKIVRISAAGDARIIIRSTVSGERDYMNASGEDVVKITPHTDEVLIFTEEASHIDIDVLGINDCATNWDTLCADESYLLELIGISNTVSPSEQELLQILDWSANNVVWSDESDLSLVTLELAQRYSAEQMYSTVYEAESSGGSANASSVFLAKLLNELGYQSITITFGAERGPTHTSALVYDPFGDRKFYVIDPAFNAILVNETSGSWVSLNEILAGNISGVMLRERPIARRKVLLHNLSSEYTDCRAAKGRASALVCFGTGYDFDSFMVQFKNTDKGADIPLGQVGYTKMLQQTYFYIGNEADDDVRNQLIKLLRHYDIKFEG